MANNRVTVTIRLSWWWSWYAAGVVLVSNLTQCDPDPAKVQAWARRAVRMTVVRDDGQS